jgi:hypothetical protein
MPHLCTEQLRINSRMPKSMKARFDDKTRRQYGRVSQLNNPVIQRPPVNENVLRKDVQA